MPPGLQGGGWEGFRHVVEELRAGLRVLTPQPALLREVVGRIPGGEGLSSAERRAVMRGLERVWHIMRLLGLLSEFFGERMFFGGGAVLNYIYMVRHGKPPRLTFDLDSAWYRRVSGKRAVLGEMVLFNKWLDEQGYTLSIPVSRGKAAKLYVVEYDAEKDFFPTLLSLRVPVVTRYDGRPFHEFLGIEDYSVIAELRRVFREVLGVRDPRIDYVRFEVSLDPAGMPREEAALLDLFGSSVRATITPVEYQLASKIRFKLAKDFGAELRYNIHDILKATLDLRLLEHVDIDAVKRYAGSFDKGAVEANLSALLTGEGRRLWERNYHYTLIRRRHTLDELIKRVKKKLLQTNTP